MDGRAAASGARPLLLHACVVLAALALTVAALAFYAERVLFDSGRFADRVETALSEPAVARDVGGTLTDAIVASRPDLIAVEPLLRSVAEQVVRSAPFRALVGRAAFEVHATVFDRGRDSAVLLVGNGALLVTQALAASDPAVARQIPPRLTTALASLEDGALSRAFVDLAQDADAVRGLGAIALVVAVALAVLAATLTPRTERARTVARLGWAVAVVGVLLILAVEAGRALVGGLAATPERADALRAVWTAFFGDLDVWAFALAVSGLVVVAAATSRASEPTLVRRARALALRIVARPSGLPLRVVRALVLVALGVLIALQPLEAVRLATIAAGLFVAALGLEELMTLVERPTAASPGTGRAGDAPRIGLRPFAALTALAVSGAIAVSAIGVSAATDDAPPEPGCNGAQSLCGRRLDAIAIPATHNSFSSPQDGFLLANQERGIAAQLRGGIRGLLIDMHLGVRTPRGVYTVLKEGGKSREKIEQAIGPAATQTALRLRRQIGYRGGGDEQVYLCHGFCELGAIEAVKALAEIRDWLLVNPGAVLVISIEDQVAPASVADVFRRSGLLDFVWTAPIRPVPTLGELVDSDRRVVVFGEEDTRGVSWYHDQFTYVRDTPYDLPSANALLSRQGCTIGRGTTASSFLLMNQFVAGDPPLPRPARIVNQQDAIVAHARACKAALGGLPGLIAVDFWEQGDVVGAARELNGLD
ncbi:MAG TPA: hypothetical protein VFG31_02820 [Conexibacter sp.]|nr:hypothetical protein [Conexibacter sp.]